MTIKRSRVYLGELLEQLTAATGVALRVGESHGPLDGVILSAFTRDRPLRELMDGLAKILTWRRHRSRWHATGTRPAYVLEHQPSFADAATATRSDLFNEWVADLRRFRAILALPPDERRRVAANRPDLFAGGTFESGRADLFRLISDSQVLTLLRGETVLLDVAALAPEQRQALKFTHDEGTLSPGFFLTWDNRFVAPMLWVRNSSGAATNVMNSGTWDQRWIEREEPGWCTGTSAAIQGLAVERSKAPRGKVLPGVRSLYAWLARLGEDLPASFLADPIDSRSSTGRAWLGESVEDTLVALLQNSHLTWKPCGETHLLRGKMHAVHPRDHLVPWSTIKSLRVNAEANGGYLDLDGLRTLVELEEPQLREQEDEFGLRDARRCAPWRPILRFRERLSPKQRARLSGAEGLPFRETGLPARQALSRQANGGLTRFLTTLDRDFKTAIVGLRVEAPAAVTSPRAVTWEVRVPGAPPLEMRMYLRRRKPLEQDRVSVPID